MSDTVRTWGDMVAEQRPDGIWNVRWKSGSGQVGAIRHEGEQYLVEHASGQTEEGVGTFTDAMRALWQLD